MRVAVAALAGLILALCGTTVGLINAQRAERFAVAAREMETSRHTETRRLLQSQLRLLMASHFDQMNHEAVLTAARELRNLSEDHPDWADEDLKRLIRVSAWMNPVTGSWSTPITNACHIVSANPPSLVYVVGEHQACLFDLASGQPRWTVDLPADAGGSPAAGRDPAGGLWLGLDSRLYQVSPADGAARRVLDFAAAQLPVLAGDSPDAPSPDAVTWMREVGLKHPITGIAVGPSGQAAVVLGEAVVCRVNLQPAEITWWWFGDHRRQPYTRWAKPDSPAPVKVALSENGDWLALRPGFSAAHVILIDWRKQRRHGYYANRSYPITGFAFSGDPVLLTREGELFRYDAHGFAERVVHLPDGYGIPGRVLRTGVWCRQLGPGPRPDEFLAVLTTPTGGYAVAILQVLPDTPTARITWQIPTDQYALAVCEPQGRFVAIHQEDGLFVYDCARHHSVYRQPMSYDFAGVFTDLQFSPDGSFLVLGGHWGRTTIYDTRTWKPALFQEEIAIGVTCDVLANGHGATLFSRQEDPSGIEVYDAIHWQPDWSLEVDLRWCRPIIPVGPAVPHAQFWIKGWNGEFRLLDMPSRAIIARQTAWLNLLRWDSDIAFTPDSPLIALVGHGGIVHLSTNTNLERVFDGRALQTGPVSAVAFNSDASWLALGGDGTLRLVESARWQHHPAIRQRLVELDAAEDAD